MDKHENTRDPLKWARDFLNKTVGECKEYGPPIIFYSPPAYGRIMVIGYNPGGNPKEIPQTYENAIKIPVNHDYFEDNYKLAERMKDLFSNMIRKLQESVKLNLIFYRSKNEKSLHLPKEQEKFCQEKVVEIIEELKPEYIITEGMITYDILKRLLKCTEVMDDNYMLDDIKKRRLIRMAENSSNKLIGIIHPSGAWGVSSHDRNKVKELLEQCLNG